MSFSFAADCPAVSNLRPMKPRYSLLSRFLLLTAFAAAGTAAHAAAPRIRVLLIDGQNNHGAWPQTSQVIKTVLEQSGRFDVTISRTPPDDGRKPNYGAPQPTVEDMPAELQEAWARWRPDFSKADVVISNYNGVLWPEPVREAFEAFVREGGGFVALHAADNAFAQWEEYQRMVGVGGWYGRNTRTHGPRIHWEDGRLVKDPAPHYCGAHGKRSPVLVEIRDPEHPIVRGFPEKWLHPLDEVYYNMCGPAEHLHVIATAFSDAETGGSGKDSRSSSRSITAADALSTTCWATTCRASPAGASNTCSCAAPNGRPPARSPSPRLRPAISPPKKPCKTRRRPPPKTERVHQVALPRLRARVRAPP
ncbi:MAG: hypothetical protein D6781_03405 [Verrucomicrobia bacterium]|nr:MAG: hypothetical protein D6781_03405 [Verrucomicrobiota bacterium]